jgi:hypothetical protein
MRRRYMRAGLGRVAIIAVAVTVMSGGAAYAAPIILNGSFESNSAGGTLFNMSNASFNATVSNATAFGTAEEIDLVTDGAYGIAPQDGNWKLGLHTQSSGLYDAFSLVISEALVAGQTYDLSFYAARNSGYIGTIDVGLSTSATAFGSLIAVGYPTSASGWDHFTTTFVAPNSGAFITVRTLNADDYAFVDNFSLGGTTSVPDPGSTLLLLGMGLVGLRAWRKRQ